MFKLSLIIFSISNLTWATPQSTLPQPSRWQRFCERHLIADDPYQFESIDTAQLIGEYERRRIKAVWTHHYDPQLKILRRELESRGLVFPEDETAPLNP